jgi:enterobactin synthetase component F
MLRDLQAVLAQAAAAPQRRLSGLVPPVPPAPTPQPPSATLPQLLRRQAAATPDARAVHAADGELTYAQLFARAGELAERLRALGAGPGRLVGVELHRCAQLPVAVLAALLCDAAYLPLDPDLPERRRADIIAAAQPVAVLGEGGPQLRAVAPAAPIARAARPADVVSVAHTSGTTGAPKGIMSTHAGLVNRLEWMRTHYGVGPADRVLHKTPLGFDVAQWELLLPLLAGATLVIAPPGAHRDPDELAACMQRAGVTIAHFVPSLLDAFLARRGTPLPALRLLVCSGEPLRPDTINACRARLGRDIENLYGPAEASIDVTAWSTADWQPGEPVQLGHPIDGVSVQVLAGGAPAPAGAVAEIHIGGLAPARGYLGDPRLTAERFVPDAGGGRLYRTGDLGRVLPDGGIEFLGRADRQV